MAEKTIEQLRELIVAQFKKDYPNERLYSKVFSVYVLDRYAKLMFKIYQKAKK